jgi:hypothetical protein
MEALPLSFELHKYLERFPDICQKKFGRTYDFTALEKRFAYVRRGRRELVTKDVLALFDPNETPFAKYWGTPNEKDVDQALRRTRTMMSPIGTDPRNLVRKLLDVFHSTAIASILLRFIHPKDFGIFSTPVVTLLQINGPNAVELYIALCDELKVWQHHYGLASVGETETALWSFDQVAKAGVHSPEAVKARREFDADLWAQRRRVSRVVGPFLKNYGPLELARILEDEDPKLAGMIAGEEYERLLQCALKRFYPRTKMEKSWAEPLIERLAQDKHILPEQRPELHRVWEIRNASVHAGQRPSPEEVEHMLDLIESICRRWDVAGKTN